MSEAAPFPETPQPLSGEHVASAFPFQIPQVVFNSYTHTHSASEITSFVSFSGRPLVMLVMPPVVAKSFALTLLEIVERYEAATGASVGTIPDLNERIKNYEAGRQP